MKKLALLAAAAATFAAVPAHADFTGVTAPANWTTTITGTLGTPGASAGGAVFTSSTLTLTGGNTSSALGCAGGTYAVLGPCQVQSVINRAGTYTFNWSYLTSDPAGPAGDIFGVLLDSIPITLSDPGGALAQSGQRMYSVTSSFGFFVNCTDCTEGGATATIGGLAFVPEPATPLLLVSGMVALGLLGRRGRRS
ncbi:PEP-CTERM sorting domain-containing protein [Piscinibacter koreensis]|uniref:PEP-CTERM sorting domain-containing protein n=1 Tax=Piscinibacter koreensis TaxID=2742824 RepID=A0A7Y6TWX6_9BURK|nr:PEP-CTERM sorting domain-containing protein [Schlegelella koreensis]NUZ06411.1 PEP-CTERM sorting domain-containing protein [Schlegelella koreensis]